MPISLFNPIYSDKVHPLEKCAFLRGAVNFFDFGQKAYTICHYDNNQKIEVIETKSVKLSWVKTLLRVGALATVVFPLLMAIGAMIYRSVNFFQVSNATNELNNEKIPSDILSFIFYKLGPSILRIATTNKANNEIIERNKPLKEDQIIYKALEKSYFLALELKRTMKAYGNQISWNDNTLTFKGSDYPLATIAMITALSDPQKALEITNSIEYPLHKMAASAFIAKRLIESNQETLALKIIEKAIKAPFIGYYQKNFIPALKVLALLERKNAIALAKTMEENNYGGKFNKIKALIELSKIEDEFDPENAKELLEQAITIARSDARAHGYLVERSFTAIIEVAAILDPVKVETLIEETLERINPIPRMGDKIKAMGTLAKAVFSYDSLRAAEILEKAIIADVGGQSLYRYADWYTTVFEDLQFLSPELGEKLADLAIEKVKENMFRSEFLAQFAEGLVRSNPKKAKELLDLAIKDLNLLSIDFRIKVSIGIAKTLFQFDSIQAAKMLEEAILLLNHNHVYSKNGIAKTLFQSDSIQAAKMYEEAILLINHNHVYSKNELKAAIAVALVETNKLLKGINLANDIKEIDKSGEDLSTDLRMSCLLEICCSKLAPSFSDKFTRTDLKMSCLLEICCSKLAPSFSAKLTKDEIWDL